MPHHCDQRDGEAQDAYVLGAEEPLERFEGVVIAIYHRTNDVEDKWIVSLDGNYVYGYCRAEDTGGFIYWNDGRNVDLYMHSEADCDNWGVRGVRIYVLPASY